MGEMKVLKEGKTESFQEAQHPNDRSSRNREGGKHAQSKGHDPQLEKSHHTVQSSVWVDSHPKHSTLESQDGDEEVVLEASGGWGVDSKSDDIGLLDNKRQARRQENNAVNSLRKVVFQSSIFSFNFLL